MSLTHKPRVGSFVKWPVATGLGFSKPYKVIEVKDDGICWIQAEGEKATCFIYKFKDGWNKLAVHCDASGKELP